MATTHLQGTAVTTSGEIPKVGDKLPEFKLVGAELNEISTEDFSGRRLILNIFPSIDTGVCATSVRHFNQAAASLENTTVLCISKDLPMALGRFCGAEGIANVTVASAFRSRFGEDFGVTLLDSPLEGLFARTLIVADETGTVVYSDLVNEIAQEPDYQAALAALG